MLPALLAAAPAMMGAAKPAPAGPAISSSGGQQTSGQWVVATGRGNAAGGINPWIIGGVIIAAMVGLKLWKH